MKNNNYFVTTIKTAYSVESYFHEKENGLDDLLGFLCFCDAYEIENTRQATENEIKRYNEACKEYAARDEEKRFFYGMACLYALSDLCFDQFYFDNIM